MGFLERLRETALERKSIVCMGIDPRLEKIPVKGGTESRITKFYFDILDGVVSEGRGVSALKPNYAYFAQYGFEGLRALEKIMKRGSEHFLVILDAKRGDIGESSRAYAEEIFHFWNADATTVSPYMGYDSVEPFLSHCPEGKGVYVLCRTSNKGSSDFQEWGEKERLYTKVSKKIIDWHTNGIGAVVGATNIKELKEIAGAFNASSKQIPLLIPGVGAQGGSASDVSSALSAINRDNIFIHRINSSGGINYAYEKEKTDDYVGAAIREIRRLDKEIGLGGNTP
jgi:orotidine-5'-phosphate decarboxylase